MPHSVDELTMSFKTHWWYLIELNSLTIWNQTRNKSLINHISYWNERIFYHTFLHVVFFESAL